MWLDIASSLLLFSLPNHKVVSAAEQKVIVHVAPRGALTGSTSRTLRDGLVLLLI